MNIKIKLILIISLGSLLFGCGFHLRGNGPNVSGANIGNSRVYLAAIQNAGLLHRQILRDLQFSEAQVIDDPEKADWHIIVLSAKTENKSVGIDSSGRSNEYEIIISVKYIVNSSKTLNSSIKAVRLKNLMKLKIGF